MSKGKLEYWKKNIKKIKYIIIKKMSELNSIRLPT